MAVNEQGDVFVSDFGSGGKVDATGETTTNHGRVLVLEDGATTQKELIPEVGNPRSIAVAADRTVYVSQIFDSEPIVQYAPGSREPTALPDDFTARTTTALAVTADGDLYAFGLDTYSEIVVLERGSTTPTVLLDFYLGTGPNAVRDNGDVYGIGGSPADADILRVKAGTTDVENLPVTGLTDPVLRLAVNHQGDVFVLAVHCADGRLSCPGGFRVLRFPSGSSTPTEMPFTGLTNPQSIAVTDDTVYLTDGTRVLAMPFA